MNDTAKRVYISKGDTPGKPNKMRGISRIRNPVTFSCQVSLLDFLWVLPLQCLHLPEQGSGKAMQVFTV